MSNQGEIKVAENTVDTHGQAYENAASYLKEQALSPTDDKSTISANSNSKNSFKAAEALVECLGSEIDAEAKTIRATGLEFKEYDQMIANYIANDKEEE